MASLRTQNALLFVIAVCLVLLVVHFYSGHLVAQAQAAQAPKAPAAKAPAPSSPKDPLEEYPADSKAAHLYGRTCRTVEQHREQCQWVPVSVDQIRNEGENRTGMIGEYGYRFTGYALSGKP